MWLEPVAIAVWVCAPGAAPRVQAFYPPRMAVQVASGTLALPDGTELDVRGGELSVAPPVVREEVLESEPLPLLTLKPRLDTLMLGFLFRSIVPGSVRVTSADGALTYDLGRDYEFDPERGQVRPVKGRLVGRVKISYKLVTQRIDLVQVSRDGKVTVKKGTPAVVCPTRPDPDPGALPLAGIYVHTANHPGQFVVTQDDIFPVGPAPPVQPINPRGVARSLAKLRAGETLTIAFFGDSITLGAEAGKWWADRSRTYTGLVVAGLRRLFPRAAIVEVPAYRGGVNTISGRTVFESRVLPFSPPLPGEKRAVVWWEAEKPSESNFPATTLFSPATDAERDRLSGGRWLTSMGQRQGEPLRAAYRIAVKTTARYRLYVRKFANRGAFRWRFDRGEWTTCPARQPSEDTVEFRRFVELAWVRLGQVELRAGEHRFEIELLAGPGRDQLSGFDCFALVAGPFRPSGKQKPVPLGLAALAWWEGEDAATDNFPECAAFVPTDDDQRAALSGARWLHTDTIPLSGRLLATWRVAVGQSGRYRFFARALAIQAPFRWRFDGQEWRPSPPAARPLDLAPFRPGVEVAWVELGTVGLDAGSHTLEVEIPGQPGQLTDVAFDCFALAIGSFQPHGKAKPAPGERYIDLLVIALGMNDTHVAIPRFKDNLRAYVAEARRRGMEVLLVTPIAPNPWLERADPRAVGKAQTAKAIVEVAKETGVACADVHTEWQNLARRGIPPFSQLHNWINHPGEAGMRLYADVILRFFQPGGTK